MIRPLVLAASLALSPLAAAAEGYLSINWSPRTAEEAQAFQLGLQLYALHRGLRGAEVRQQGRNNSAELRQSGQGHLGIVRQRGQGHQARLIQRGQGHGQVIVQSGRGTSAQIVQQGRGQMGFTFLHGW